MRTRLLMIAVIGLVGCGGGGGPQTRTLVEKKQKLPEQVVEQEDKLEKTSSEEEGAIADLVQKLTSGTATKQERTQIVTLLQGGDSHDERIAQKNVTAFVAALVVKDISKEQQARLFDFLKDYYNPPPSAPSRMLVIALVDLMWSLQSKDAENVTDEETNAFKQAIAFLSDINQNENINTILVFLNDSQWQMQYFGALALDDLDTAHALSKRIDSSKQAVIRALMALLDTETYLNAHWGRVIDILSRLAMAEEHPEIFKKLSEVSNWKTGNASRDKAEQVVPHMKTLSWYQEKQTDKQPDLEEKQKEETVDALAKVRGLLKNKQTTALEGNDIPLVNAILNDSKEAEDVRIEAAIVLGDKGTSGVYWQSLIQIAQNQNESKNLRASAIRALGGKSRLGKITDLDWLVPLLVEKDEALSSAADYTFSEILLYGEAVPIVQKLTSLRQTHENNEDISLKIHRGLFQYFLNNTSSPKTINMVIIAMWQSFERDQTKSIAERTMLPINAPKGSSFAPEPELRAFWIWKLKSTDLDDIETRNAVVKMLEDPDPRVRIQAATAISSVVSQPEIKKTLIASCMKSDDKKPLNLPVVASLWSQTKITKEPRLGHIYQILEECQKHLAIGEIFGFLSEERAEIREFGIYAISVRYSTEPDLLFKGLMIDVAIKRLIKDPDKDVRSRAIFFLQGRTEEAEKILTAFGSAELTESDPEVQSFIALAVVQLEEAVTYPILELIGKGNDEAKVKLFQYLENEGLKNNILSALHRFLSHEPKNSLTRWTLLKVIGLHTPRTPDLVHLILKFATSDDKELVWDMIRDSGLDVTERSNALRVMGKLGDPGDLDVLMVSGDFAKPDLVEATKEAVQEMLKKFLEKFNGDQPSIDDHTVIFALSDVVISARNTARAREIEWKDYRSPIMEIAETFLVKIGEKLGTDRLIGYLSNPPLEKIHTPVNRGMIDGWNVRAFGIWVLRERYDNLDDDQKKKVKEALTSLLLDNNAEVRLDAKNALDVIAAVKDQPSEKPLSATDYDNIAMGKDANAEQKFWRYLTDPEKRKSVIQWLQPYLKNADEENSLGMQNVLLRGLGDPEHHSAALLAVTLLQDGNVDLDDIGHAFYFKVMEKLVALVADKKTEREPIADTLVGFISHKTSGLYYQAELFAMGYRSLDDPQKDVRKNTLIKDIFLAPAETRKAPLRNWAENLIAYGIALKDDRLAFEILDAFSEKNKEDLAKVLNVMKKDKDTSPKISEKVQAYLDKKQKKEGE